MFTANVNTDHRNNIKNELYIKCLKKIMTDKDLKNIL